MKINKKYWRIARRLQAEDLQKTRSRDLKFLEEELFHLDIGRRGSSFLLGFYSREGILMALRKYGVYDDLHAKGFSDIITDINTDDPYKHRMAFYTKSKQQKNMLIELVLRRRNLTIQMPFDCNQNGRPVMALAIDWLCMQDINSAFSREKPRLPGQKFPGLGMSEKVVELLMIMCWRLNLNGLINVPEHYHNAVLYSRIFRYIEPQAEAKLLALKKNLSKYPLDKLSWGIDWECVFDVNSGSPLKWFVFEQLVPLEANLKKLFGGKQYRNYVEDKSRGYRFEFNEEKYRACKERFTEQNMEKTI